MKIIIEDPKTATKFEILFSNLVALTDYVKVCIAEEGLHIQGMDQIRICLFDIVLNCSWFTVFEIGDDDPRTFTIPARIFHKVLSTYKPDQCIEIDIIDNDKICMNFLRGTKTCDKFFVIPSADINNDLLIINESKDSQADFIVSSKKLSELVIQLEIFDDILVFDLSEEHILLKTTGDDGSMIAKLTQDDKHLIDYSIIENANIVVSFSLKYVKLMMAFTKLSEEVKIDISKGAPLMISYDLGADSIMKLILAPRIE